MEGENDGGVPACFKTRRRFYPVFPPEKKTGPFCSLFPPVFPRTNQAPRSAQEA